MISIIAIVLGITSIPFAFYACTGYLFVVPLLLSLIGAAMGALGMMREGNSDRRMLSMIAIGCAVIGLIMSIVCFACSGCDICRYGGQISSLSNMF
ncbi:MAG TPA: hypothetical protein IAB02_07505 [Candidatus Pullichristensenella excrementigallinarum]|uniref:Uncharacterized protein n=1 Tax=Candidatus Pullichristensenella excrementigallinarum TaxID=2840907 RepID=A0A9D1IEH5_9FIRM|nr:hypothetical protein [Candidatus Pullichristensenella excrementigallinarum]